MILAPLETVRMVSIPTPVHVLLAALEYTVRMRNSHPHPVTLIPACMAVNAPQVTVTIPAPALQDLQALTVKQTLMTALLTHVSMVLAKTESMVMCVSVQPHR